MLLLYIYFLLIVCHYVKETINVFFQSVTQPYLIKENPSVPIRSRTYDLPITSLDALSLSYRRLIGAMLAYSQDLNVDEWICVKENVMFFCFSFLSLVNK